MDYYILPVCVVYSPGSCSYYIAEHFFSCFINGVPIACLVIEKQSKPLKQLKVGVLPVQVVIWVISKIEERICNLTIRLPSLPSGSLSVALEPRGGVTTSKGVREYNELGHYSRCIRTKRCTDGIDAYKLEVLSHTQTYPDIGRGM